MEEASGTEDDLVAALDGARVCLTQMAPFTARVFDAAPDLEMVAVSRGGPVNVDLAAADRAGVAVAQAPGRNAAAAAEYAVGMALAALRRIPMADRELRDGIWRGDLYAYDEAGLELDGTTVGLVGYGAIGRIVARVLRAFGATVLVADPYTDEATAGTDGVRLVGLDELLRSSSVVSLHARLSDETRGMIGARELDLLPQGAVLVNTARGGLLDYGPLPEALRSGQPRRARARRLRRRTAPRRLAPAPRPERRRHPAPRRGDEADRAPRGVHRRRRGRALPARRAAAPPGERGRPRTHRGGGVVIVGVDVGTSMTKADAYDDAGRKLASAERASRLEQFADGRVEQDLEDVVSSVVDVVRRVVADAGRARAGPGPHRAGRRAVAARRRRRRDAPADLLAGRPGGRRGPRLAGRRHRRRGLPPHRRRACSPAATRRCSPRSDATSRSRWSGPRSPATASTPWSSASPGRSPSTPRTRRCPSSTSSPGPTTRARSRPAGSASGAGSSPTPRRRAPSSPSTAAARSSSACPRAPR